jgi:alkylated DNA repair dioxygenase AlkB
VGGGAGALGGYLPGMPRAPSTAAPPPGLVYRPDFLNPEEEGRLLDILEPLAFEEIRMRGQVARRTALHYGVDYDYEQRRRRASGAPLPAWLLPVRERAAELAGVAPEELAEALVQRYPPGAAIGWHRDAPGFGSVVGVSLGSACRLRFQRGAGAGRQVAELLLEPRSAYLLAGSARWGWQHGIPPTTTTRCSITFRTLREAGDRGALAEAPGGARS